MRGITGRAWAAPEVGKGEGLLTHILRSRGITVENEASFLTPKVKDALPDPDRLLGLPETAKRLAEDIRKGRKIGIYSDYDADGATSAGVLGRFIRDSGVPHHDLVIPDREEHGYGPHAGLLSKMFENGVETIYVLDSGTVATAIFAQLPEDQRRSIFVVDHHMPSGDLPDVGAVVNPNRKDQTPGLGHLAAVGVTFLLCIGAQRELIRSGDRPRESMQGLLGLLDYVALGTVCDVVPLVGVNRAFVYFGLKQINEARKDAAYDETPIGALLVVSGKKRSDRITSSDFGFLVGPRINAEGRIGKSDAAALYLLETDPGRITAGAERLNATNIQRKDMEKSATEGAVADAQGRKADYTIVAVTEGHPGVVGISASRVKDLFNKPSIVLTTGADGMLKGSARSIDGFNIGEAIHDAVHHGLILKGGGHGMAGGMTLRPDQLEGFRKHMHEAALNSDFGRLGANMNYDAILPVSAISVPILKALDALQPCGRENPEPAFVLRDAIVGGPKDRRIMSGKHVKVQLFAEGSRRKCLDAIIWNGVGTPMGDQLAAAEDGDRLTIAGRLSINVWNDSESLQMIVEDILHDAKPEPKIDGGPG